MSIEKPYQRVPTKTQATKQESSPGPEKEPVIKIKGGVRYVCDDCLNHHFLGQGLVFSELEMVTECRFSVLIPARGFVIDGLVGIVIPAKTVIRIPIEAFQMKAGTVLAYYKENGE